MIELDDIEYLNFFNIKHAHVQLANQGFVGVQGDNGSGKTAMFIEGPFFSLYGKSIRQDKAVGTKLRRRGAKGWATVLNLNDGKNKYKIQRAKGIKELKTGLTVEMNGKDISRGTMADTQEMIEDTIIGMSSLAAKNAVFYTAETMSFPSMGDTKKKEVLDNLLCLAGLEVALKSTKKEVSRLASECAALETKQVTYEEMLKAAEIELEEKKDLSKVWEREKNDRIAKATAHSLELATVAEGFDDEIADLHKAIQSATYETQKRATKLAKMAEGVPALEAEITKEMGAYMTARAVAGSELENARTALAKHKALLGKEGGECSLCGAVLETDEAAVARHEKAIKEQEAAVEVKVKEFAAIKEPDLKDLREKVAAIRADVKSTQDAKANWESQGKKSQTELSAVELAKSRAEGAAEVAQQALATEEKATNPYAEVVTGLETNIEKHKASIETATINLSATADMLREERVLEVLYGPKGCRIDLLNVAIPHLNLKAEEFRRILNTGLKVSFRLKNDDEAYAGTLFTEVDNPNGADSYEWDSRGERRRADIIMLMGLLSLTSARGARSMNQAFFDEAFESLDGEGEASMLGLLRHISANRSSVFTISHNAHDLSGRVDKHWTVKDGVLTT